MVGGGDREAGARQGMGGSGGRSVVVVAALLALVGGQILPDVEDAVFTDTIRKMPAKEVKRFVRANG